MPALSGGVHAPTRDGRLVVFPSSSFVCHSTCMSGNHGFRYCSYALFLCTVGPNVSLPTLLADNGTSPVDSKFPWLNLGRDVARFE